MSDNSNKLADKLGHILADTYLLCLKTQNYHWNVTGPSFPSLHAFFEEQYTQLFEAGDAIAERIRSLGFPAPGSYKAFSTLSSLEEEEGTPSPDKMVKNLSADHKTVIANLNALVPFAQDCKDEGTTDFLVERLREHEKTLWMLESSV